MMAKEKRTTSGNMEISGERNEGLRVNVGPGTRLVLVHVYTRGVQKVLQIDIHKIHKALEFDFI